jgi:hypothetical protein
MHISLRKLLCLSLALLLASTPLLRAQQSSNTAPIPPQISSAHTVFVANGGGSNYYNAFTGGPDRAYSQLYADLRQWNRYQLVDSPQQADLIFEVHANATLIDAGGPHSVATYNPQLVLRILDAKTNGVLWTLTSNVRALGRQKTRDRQFDSSVALLIDQARRLNGEQLTAAQQKALTANVHTPTATKVIVGLAIGGAVVATALIIHTVATRKQPTLPTVPTSPCITPTFCPA